MALEDMRDLLLTNDSALPPFKPIRTLPFVIFLLISDVNYIISTEIFQVLTVSHLFQVTILITSFVLPQHFESQDLSGRPSLYSTLLYSQIAFWIVTVVTLKTAISTFPDLNVFPDFFLAGY